MDDIRMAGAAVVLGENAQLTDDLVAAGYSVESKDGSSVGGDSLIVGYQVLMAGDTAQDAKVTANKVQLSGSVGGDLNVEVGASERMPAIPPATFMPNMPAVPTIPAGLTIKPGSSIGGNLTYTSPQEAMIPPGAVSGNVVHQFPVVEAGKENTAAEQTSNWLFINLRNIVSPRPHRLQALARGSVAFPRAGRSRFVSPSSGRRIPAVREGDITRFLEP